LAKVSIKYYLPVLLVDRATLYQPKSTDSSSRIFVLQLGVLIPLINTQRAV
jgi:hypothetical protein